MRTSYVKNALVMVVILLFIGVAVQPSIATVQPEKIDGKPDIEGVGAQLRIAINEKFENYESKPKLAGFWDIIDNLLVLLEKILKQFSCHILTDYFKLIRLID